MNGKFESAFPGAPAAPVARLTSVVVRFTMSRTKTSTAALSSSVERLSASESKAT